MTNSIRDNVKDAIREVLYRRDEEADADLIATIADAVFYALGISEKDQDRLSER